MAKELVKQEIELAEMFLSDARILLNAGGSPKSVMNRIYYSVFHSSKAVLIKQGFEPKTHKGTINLFWNEIARKGLCSLDSAKFLARAFKEREEADYEPLTAISEEKVRDFLEKAGLFLEEMKNIISNNAK